MGRKGAKEYGGSLSVISCYSVDNFTVSEENTFQAILDPIL
jgi:hypothetical protein